MVEHQPSKLDTWVRFPSPALLFCSGSLDFAGFPNLLFSIVAGTIWYDSKTAYKAKALSMAAACSSLDSIQSKEYNFIFANKFSFGIIFVGVTKMVCGSPFAKMSTF